MTSQRGRLDKRLVRHVRKAALRAAAVLVAATVLLATVRGGTRFFYCPMTQLAFDEAPCAPSRDALDDDALAIDDALDVANDAFDVANDLGSPSVRTADCCEERWRAAAPIAESPRFERPNVAPPGLAAVAFADDRLTQDTRARTSTLVAVANAVRAGPPPPSARERRARLMVFHI